MIDVRKDDSADLRCNVEQQVRFVFGIGLSDCNHLQLHCSNLFVLCDWKMLHGGLQALLYKVYKTVWQTLRIHKHVKGLKECYFCFFWHKVFQSVRYFIFLVIIGAKILYVHFLLPTGIILNSLTYIFFLI